MAAAITSVVPAYTGAGEGKAVRWAGWLSKTALEPAATFQYGLLFAENELEEEDAAHFDHEFLLSMGISVAKHRLEILKLAHRDRRRRRTPPSRAGARIFAAAAAARRRLVRCLHSLTGGKGGGTGIGSSSAVVAPRRSPFTEGGIWPSAVSKWSCSRAGPHLPGRKMLSNGGGGGGGGGGRAADGQKRWDTMFQDLKPT